MYYGNLTLLTDLYQLTMMQGYHNTSLADKTAVFDLFYRRNPSGNGYAITAGLEQAARYIENLRFNESDIGYLRGLGLFTEDFLFKLSKFKFTGDIYAIPEGTPVFPQEPLVRVTARLLEAQFVETALLNIINHQSLIATKAARVVSAAGGDGVLEFGLRRAQGPDAGIYGARAAMIGGCAATSDVLAGKMFGVPVRGTHAHSWVMSMEDEYRALKTYAKCFPETCTLLVDTYDTLKSGLPNTIRVFTEMREAGVKFKSYGIRLDSGDLAYLSKRARRTLDEAGFTDAVISASGDLDEYLITSLKLQGAKIDVWGVGTNLVTSNDDPAFGGVYKLAAEITADGTVIPKIKLSENPEKVTNPGVKKVIRLYDKATAKVKADVIALDGERANTNDDLTIFDPTATWKRMTLKAGSYTARDLLVPVFINGECVYESPAVMDIREYSKNELAGFWDEHKRLVNPHPLPVDLSQELYDLKESMILKIRSAPAGGAAV